MNLFVKALFLFLNLSITFSLQASNSNWEELLWTVDWSPDDELIAVGGNHDSLKFYSGKSFKFIKSYPVNGTITAVKWHPTKKLLAVGTQGSDAHVFLLNYNADQIIKLEAHNLTGARGIDWNHDGQYLGVGDGEGVVHIFTQEGKLQGSIPKEDTKSYTTLSWHPNKNILVVGSAKVRLYNLNGEALKTFPHRKEATLLLCTDWHPSGEFFALGDYGDNQYHYPPLLRFFNTEGDALKTIQGSKAEYRTIAWHKSGKKLASASDVLRIWSKKGKLIAQSPNVNDNLWGLDWNKKGNRLITTSSNGKIQIWNKKAKLLKTLD